MHAEARYFGNSEYVACLGNISVRNLAAQFWFIRIFAVQQLCTCEILGVRCGKFYTEIEWLKGVSSISGMLCKKFA